MPCSNTAAAVDAVNVAKRNNLLHLVNMKLKNEDPKRNGDRFDVVVYWPSEHHRAYVYADRVELTGYISSRFRDEFECWKLDEWPRIEKLQAALKGAPVGAASIRFE